MDGSFCLLCSMLSLSACGWPIGEGGRGGGWYTTIPMLLPILNMIMVLLWLLRGRFHFANAYARARHQRNAKFHILCRSVWFGFRKWKLYFTLWFMCRDSLFCLWNWIFRVSSLCLEYWMKVRLNEWNDNEWKEQSEWSRPSLTTNTLNVDGNNEARKKHYCQTAYNSNSRQHKRTRAHLCVST